MTMRMPGSFIEEGGRNPSAVLAVSTSVPAFVGYTAKADQGSRSLRNTPWRIASLADFEQHFGGSPLATAVRFSFAESASTEEGTLTLASGSYRLQQTHGFYLLHSAMRLYFLNGGGPCYVVSVGGFEGSQGSKGESGGVQVSAAALLAGLSALQGESEPAVVLIPEAVLLSKAECAGVQNELLVQCGNSLQLQARNRFAILDVHDGHQARNDGTSDCIEEFRTVIGVGQAGDGDGNGNGNGNESGNALSYGAAYYPWLHTNVLAASAVGFRNLATDSLPALVAVLQQELLMLKMTPLRRSRLQVQASLIAAALASNTKAQAALDKRWAAISPAFKAVQIEMVRQLNLLPPSAAIAAVFAATDVARGVWKAPANVALNAVLSPAVTLSDADQAPLNIDVLQGKSINAIRAFPGRGAMVWGSRTLDGNSNDWRYISVRRHAMMIEQSAQRVLAAFVFESNDAASWTAVRVSLEEFLYSQWRQGALAGAKPEDAFAVQVGLGISMTQADVEAGLMHVILLLAPARPAEFIEIRLTQQLRM